MCPVQRVDNTNQSFGYSMFELNTNIAYTCHTGHGHTDGNFNKAVTLMAY